MMALAHLGVAYVCSCEISSFEKVEAYGDGVEANISIDMIPDGGGSGNAAFFITIESAAPHFDVSETQERRKLNKRRVVA